MFIRSLRVTPFAAYAPRDRWRPSITGGYHVTATITDSLTDGMYDPMAHPAVFQTMEQAEQFCLRVQRHLDQVNLNHWRLTDHPCAAFQAKPDENPPYYCPVCFHLM